jgi:hypothetical protein
MKRLAWLTALSLGALLAAGCAQKPTPVPSAKGFAPGQKWEYKVVKIEKDEERDLTTVLNIQAKDGWEYHGQITTDAHYLVFQRSTGQVGFSGATAKYPVTTAIRKAPVTAPAGTKPAAPLKEPAPGKSPEPVKPPEK